MSNTIDANALTTFKSSLRGGVIEPGDDGYDQARKVYNAMIEKKPRLIVRCVDVADVIASVNFARENDILLSIRGGGHNAGGLGICDDGLVIDLSGIKYTRVDPAAQTITVGGGCTWGDVDHANHAFGFATPSGIISTTGVGGLSLGGGIGHLTRKYGLTIDNLLSADVVLADGRFVRADAKENPDLFWALRGGGGNFGVVTAFTFRTHRVSTVYAGPMLYELSESAEVMKWYRDFLPAAPDDLNGFFAFLTVPPAPPFPEHLQMKKMCGWSGPIPAIWRKRRRCSSQSGLSRNRRSILSDRCRIRRCKACSTRFSRPGCNGIGAPISSMNSAMNRFRNTFNSQTKCPRGSQPRIFIRLMALRDALGKTDTAWNARGARWASVIVGVDPDPANKEKITAWTKNYFDAVHPLWVGRRLRQFYDGG